MKYPVLSLICLLSLNKLNILILLFYLQVGVSANISQINSYVRASKFSISYLLVFLRKFFNNIYFWRFSFEINFVKNNFGFLKLIFFSFFEMKIMHSFKLKQKKILKWKRKNLLLTRIKVQIRVKLGVVCFGQSKILW